MAERVLVEWSSVGISWNGAPLILASGKTEPPEPPARPDARCWWCQYKTQTSGWMQRAATPPEADAWRRCYGGSSHHLVEPPFANRPILVVEHIRQGRTTYKADLHSPTE